MRNYTETYQYDAVGNILEMIHASGAAATSWTRRYDVSTSNNRHLRTSVANDLPTQFSAQYGYDVHGNMTSMPHLAAIGWNYRDEMVSANKGNGELVYFTYDASGERVRKVYVHSGLIEERIYLGGWEIYRKRLVSAPDEIVLERETLHMMDGVRRIALVETKTVDAGAGGAFQPSTVTRFQMGNHLGSATLEVDAAGLVISYEEYHPYGTTAYSAASGAVEASRKRYRYTAKEKDEETGLYYHGARYYACWAAGSVLRQRRCLAEDGVTARAAGWCGQTCAMAPSVIPGSDRARALRAPNRTGSRGESATATATPTERSGPVIVAVAVADPPVPGPRDRRFSRRRRQRFDRRSKRGRGEPL